jgi:hypothetical protein
MYIGTHVYSWPQQLLTYLFLLMVFLLPVLLLLLLLLLLQGVWGCCGVCCSQATTLSGGCGDRV